MPLAGETGMAWADAWHMQNDLMLLADDPVEGADVSAVGSYAAPPGPDWGWRISLHAQPDFRIVMHNITPDGEEQRAAEFALLPG